MDAPIDARSLASDTTLESDVCIVGAGAAGITLARALAATGVDVCLVESGGFEHDAATQDLYRAGDARGHPYFALDACRLRWFGGTTNHWVGWCRPPDPIDFEEKPWAPGTGWPFGRAELDPYFARAQAVCELGPFDYGLERWLDPGGPQPLPVAPPLRTTVFQLSPPTRFGSAYRDEVVGSPRIRTLLHANVVAVEADETRRRVERLRVATLSGQRFSVRGRRYVLAAGGIENARLLLASEVGNDRDLVGRHFMEHLHLVSGFLLPSAPDFDVAFYHPHRKGDQRLVGALVLTPEAQRELEVLAVSVTFFPTERMDESFVAAEHSLGWESFRALGRAVKNQRMPEDFARHLGNVLRDLDDVALAGYARVFEPTEPGTMFKLFLRSEQAPNPRSRISLSDERDALGMRRPRIEWHFDELDVSTLRRTQERVAQELGRLGLGRVYLPPDDEERTWEDAIFGGNHHMGTTRMDRDPTRGVVDADCRVHGIANLFVAGSSVFPGVGFSNPTLTIVAMALRLADHLAAGAGTDA